MKTINKLLATIVATLLIFSSSVLPQINMIYGYGWGGGPLMEIGAKALKMLKDVKWENTD